MVRVDVDGSLRSCADGKKLPNADMLKDLIFTCIALCLVQVLGDVFTPVCIAMEGVDQLKDAS